MGKLKQRWFIKIRGSYLPKTWQAWLSFVPFTAFLVTVVILAVQEGTILQSVFLEIIPAWVAAAVVMTWLAELQS